MKTFALSDKIIFGIAMAMIVVFTAYGFYMIDAEPPIKALATSGHNHMLSFAYGAVLFGLLMRLVNISERAKRALAAWMSTTYFGPLALVYAGMSGDTALLAVSSPLFMGSFVALWAILLFYLLRE